MDSRSCIRGVVWGTRMVNISYLNFRRFLLARERGTRKKKLHSSRDNNVQIGNFPIYDKIWIRDAIAWMMEDSAVCVATGVEKWKPFMKLLRAQNCSQPWLPEFLLAKHSRPTKYRSIRHSEFAQIFIREISSALDGCNLIISDIYSGSKICHKNSARQWKASETSKFSNEINRDNKEISLHSHTTLSVFVFFRLGIMMISKALKSLTRVENWI